MYGETLTRITNEIAKRPEDWSRSELGLLLERLRALSADSRQLLGRILGRREGWLRAKSLNYSEIENPDDTLDELVAGAFLTVWPSGEGAAIPAELLDDLSGLELNMLLNRLGESTEGSPGARRQRFCRRLDQPGHPGLSHQHNLLLEELSSDPLAALEELGPFYRLADPAEFRLLMLAWSGDMRIGFQDALLEAFGKVQYENRVDVTVTPSLVGQQLTDQHTFRESTLLLADELQREEPDLDTCYLTWRRLERIAGSGAETLYLRQRQRFMGQLRCHLASLLERLGRYRAANLLHKRNLDCDTQGSGWKQSLRRLPVNLGHLAGRRVAQRAAFELLPVTQSRKLRLELLKRCGNKWQAPEALIEEYYQTVQHPGWRGGKALGIGLKGGALTVEERVLEQLEDDGWEGIHCESRLINALAGLVAWDVIFAPLPGAFIHPLQTGPLDWGVKGFLDRRKESWSALCDRLRESAIDQLVQDAIESKSGLINPLVSWKWLADEKGSSSISPLDALLRLADSLTSKELLCITRLLLDSPADYASGAPDLLLFKDDGSPELCFAEVKGPGDSLQSGQQLWIDLLAGIGLPVRLIHLKENRGASS
jgi:hypothetical protein